MKKTMKRFVTCGLAILLCSMALRAQQAKGKRMNVIFYLVDDLGWADLPDALTPPGDGATEAEIEDWVERFIDASAQLQEITHAR